MTLATSNFVNFLHLVATWHLDNPNDTWKPDYP